MHRSIHRVPYASGGSTGPGNLNALARRFHVDKTRHGWRLDAGADGILVWSSPAGRTYRVAPEPVGPVTDPGHDPPARPDIGGDPPPF